jgi:hypothetical protein
MAGLLWPGNFVVIAGIMMADCRNFVAPHELRQ